MDSKVPLSSIDRHSFNHFCRQMNCFYPVPSRRTVTRGIEESYEEAYVKIMKVFQEIPGRVSLTADGWSSRTMKWYFVVTIHWIGADWKHHSCLLDFVYFPAPHNQWSTSELLLKIMTEFSVHTKVRSITTDSGLHERRSGI